MTKNLNMQLALQEAVASEHAQRMGALRAEAERLERELDEWRRTVAYRRARRESEVV